MIGTFWFQLNQINAGSSRPQGYAPYVTRKVGVLARRDDGRGHRLCQCLCGYRGGAQGHHPGRRRKGKAHSAALLDRKVSRGQLTAEQRETTLARIHPTQDDADLAGCDLIIEAVFEDRALKAKVSAAAQNVVGPTR